MGEIHNLFVRFDEYCWKCKHLDKTEVEEPCKTCVASPVNERTHAPVKYEEK